MNALKAPGTREADRLALEAYERLRTRLARELGAAVAALVPDLVVREVRRAARPGKVYVDWLQNDPTRQTVAPYSLRGLPWPVVATPVRWGEVEAAAEEERPELLFFTPADVLERVQHQGDLFAALA